MRPVLGIVGREIRSVDFRLARRHPSGVVRVGGRFDIVTANVEDERISEYRSGAVSLIA